MRGHTGVAQRQQRGGLPALRHFMFLLPCRYIELQSGAVTACLWSLPCHHLAPPCRSLPSFCGGACRAHPQIPLCDIQVPSRKLAGKDRVAVIAKQLNDFIYLYNRETDLYADSVEGPENVDSQLFQRFLAVANEPELEEVLTLQTRLYKCAHIYLGRCGPPVTDLRSVGLLRSLPDLTNASDCECVRRCGVRPSLPRLTRKPPSTPQRTLSQYKSRSLDSQPAAEDTNENKAPPETPTPPPVIAAKPEAKVNKVEAKSIPHSRSCYFRKQTSTEENKTNTEPIITNTMRKSISLQESTFRKVRSKINVEDVNFVNSDSSSIIKNKNKESDRGRDRSTKSESMKTRPKLNQTLKNPHRRSLSGDSVRDTSPVRQVMSSSLVQKTERHPIGHRSLPRLVGAFRSREEEEAAVRRLLQPLRHQSQPLATAK